MNYMHCFVEMVALVVVAVVVGVGHNSYYFEGRVEVGIEDTGWVQVYTV